MADHDIIFRYFPDMNERQRAQVQALAGLYGEWNARINVISRMTRLRTSIQPL